MDYKQVTIPSVEVVGAETSTSQSEVATNQHKKNVDLLLQDVETVDSDDDVLIIHDAGVNPLFPDAPILSKNFQEYLSVLQKQNVEDIKALIYKPPKPLAGTQSVSHLFLTGNDLGEIQLEITRSMEKMSEDDRRDFSANPDVSFKILILHEYLTSCILRAKQRCVRDYQLAVKASTSLIEAINDPIDPIGHALYWQTGVFNDSYRQSLKTTFTDKDTET